MNIRFYHAKILQTNVNHTFDIIEGELWVQGDTICYIGDATDTQEVFQRQPTGIILWDREIDAAGNLLIPGFKNAHTHSAMTFLRSFADDLPLQDWLNQQVFPKEALLEAQDVYTLNILAIMEYLTSGITANFDMYSYQMEHAKASEACGFRTVLCGALNDFVSSVSELEENFCKVQESKLTSYIMGFHAEYTTSEKLLSELAQLTQKRKLPVYSHNSETKQEVLDCKSRYGLTPTELTERMGLYEYGGGGFHCVWFTENDFQIYQKRGLSVVTNPASNLKLASGVAPVCEFTKRGINLAIGTDGPASNNCLDMFREMFLTTALAKVRENDASCIPAQEVLYMATAGGAKAMGLSDCDCLAVGKQADLVMIDLMQPNMQPENNIVKNIVYSGSKQNVKLTMVAGRILYENQKYQIGIEPAEIYAEANRIIRRIRENV